ncbi:MAG: GntR family transcriptional regulator [Anaerolineales bacterium]|jgi:DNA-binding GntR family transcriptional regulator
MMMTDPVSSQNLTANHALDNLTKVKATSISDQIYTQLRSTILVGDLKPGDRITELEVASRMGTSQAPVREALQQLENDGLVERRARSGTFVTGVSLEEIRELFQIRSLVEKFAIKRTAVLIQPEQYAELQSLVHRMRLAADQEDMLTLGISDMEFHKRICEWSGKNSLVRVWMPLYSQIQRFIIQNHRRHFPDLSEVAELHMPILEAIRRGDVGLAERTIEEHIMLTFHRI